MLSLRCFMLGIEKVYRLKDYSFVIQNIYQIIVVGEKALKII